MLKGKIKMGLASISKPFLLLIEAFKNCWDEIWKSVFVMAVITIILATIFYIVESPLQPEYSNWWNDVVWAFCVYIQDPGGLGGNGPQTGTGKVIATILGYLNILIVAVPAGIIAGGFTTALEDQSKEKKFIRACENIRKAFKPLQCRHTFLRVVPPFKSVTTLQVKYGLTVDEIIGATEYSQQDDLRLRNYAELYPRDAEVYDRLIVEYFPLVGEKDYGCYVNRRSNVTIVCSSSHKTDEIADSHFGYMLAEFGGFNFMSREFDLDNKNSYYTLPSNVSFDGKEWQDSKSELSASFRHFFSDLKALATGKDTWVIFLLQFPRKLNSQVCFVSTQKNGEKEGSTVINTQSFDSAYSEISDMLSNHDYPINSGERDEDEASPLSADLNNCYKPIKERNIGIALGGGTNCNVFTIRIYSGLIARDRRDVPIALRMAEILRKNLVGKDSYIADNTPRWKTTGVDYNISS